MASTTIEYNIQLLEKAGLISIKYLPSKKGFARVCYGNLAVLSVLFCNSKTTSYSIEYKDSIGVGMYSDLKCNNERGILINDLTFRNDEADYHTNRRNATIIWLSNGEITYRFSNYFYKKYLISSISFSLEICSETNGYRNDWKSDITFSVNSKKITTWCSPGDMGDRIGLLNQDWWPRKNTQYGFLKVITISMYGCFLDGILVNDKITLLDLNVNDGNYIELKIENEENCVHKGGFNIFGKGIGDYNQDIELTAIGVEGK